MKKEKIRPDYSNIQFTKDLWHFFGKYKWKFLIFSILLMLSNLNSIFSPLILAKIIDFFVSGTQPVRIFYYLVLGLLALQAITTVLRLKSKYNISLIRYNVQRDAKVESFNRIMQADMIWHEESMTGSKMQKLLEGERAFERFISFYSNQGLGIVVSLAGILIVFTIFNIKYTLLALAFVFVYLFVERKFNKVIAKKTLRVNIMKERALGKQFDFSANISTIKSLGIEKSSYNEINNAENRVVEAKRTKRRMSNSKWITVQTIAVIFFSIFILIVGRDILAGMLTAGVIVVYISYLGQLRTMLNTISSQSEPLMEAKYGIYRMMEIYNLVPDINENGAKSLREWKNIEIKNLGFKYKDEPVLEDFSLNIAKGEKIGIVGRSGCGKSTLFKLLLKLYLPKKGMIYFDNKPITKIKRNSIQDKISIVPQETEVFNMSLKDNITISRAGKIDVPRYLESLRISQLDEFVSKLKEKDQTLIGEKGLRLSGGQKQRLGIARAIYKNSDVLVFDEATSNLDYGTEKRIQEEIDKIKGKTLIISAHRLSTLKNMNKILVMKKGVVIEKGTYDQLLRNRGEFYKIWKKQER